MNSIVTYCALAKLLKISSTENTNVVIDQMGSRLTLDFCNDTELFSAANRLIMVHTVPKIYTSIEVAAKLRKTAIDFNYQTQDFILTS
jgi:hypothetical protein